jgi:demethylmenaquinone methyltransferase / 2-methoxy-6-polyprenyl-1,4-benzoquinol methylase
MTIEKSPARVRRMFGEIAGRYDFLNHLLSLGIDRSWRRKTVKMVRPREGLGPILDVCTGTADLAIEYWKASRQMSGVWVVGSDFSRPMLDIGYKKSRRTCKEGRMELIEADSACLPFPNDMFQIVSVAFGLRNVSDLDKGLHEMVRVCRPGGVVAVLEFSMPRIRPLKKLYNWYFHSVLPRIGQSLAHNTQGAYNYLPISVGQFPQSEALVERMSKAGLQKAAFYPFTFGIATLYVGEKI